ncbi:MAG: hypothetical protein HS111_09970 [Kofleriaceae bacterium]|nr:hypothetical protein [Kofleriaceae bacterium]
MNAERDDQIRAEHLEHVACCEVQPEPDDVDGRTNYDTPNSEHVCEHIAADVAARKYFESDVAMDPGAIQDFRLVCNACYCVADRDGAPPGGRWLACYTCVQEYSLTHGWPALRHLAPRYSESFKPWWERVGSRLANVPPDVAEQWIHRHWGHSSFEWLPIMDMAFTRETWLLARVLDVRAGDRAYPRPDHRGAVPLELHDNWLGRRVRADGTWPTPIIVLDNAAEHYPMLHAVQLLEGHTRLGYLRTLAAAATAQPHHDVWVVRDAVARS